MQSAGGGREARLRRCLAGCGPFAEQGWIARRQSTTVAGPPWPWRVAGRGSVRLGTPSVFFRFFPMLSWPRQDLITTLTPRAFLAHRILPGGGLRVLHDYGHEWADEHLLATAPGCGGARQAFVSTERAFVVDMETGQVAWQAILEEVCKGSPGLAASLDRVWLAKHEGGVTVFDTRTPTGHAALHKVGCSPFPCRKRLEWAFGRDRLGLVSGDGSVAVLDRDVRMPWDVAVCFPFKDGGGVYTDSFAWLPGGRRFIVCGYEPDGSDGVQSTMVSWELGLGQQLLVPLDVCVVSARVLHPYKTGGPRAALFALAASNYNEEVLEPEFCTFAWPTGPLQRMRLLEDAACVPIWDVCASPDNDGLAVYLVNDQVRLWRPDVGGRPDPVPEPGRFPSSARGLR